MKGLPNRFQPAYPCKHSYDDTNVFNEPSHAGLTKFEQAATQIATALIIKGGYTSMVEFKEDVMRHTEALFDAIERY